MRKRLAALVSLTAIVIFSVGTASPTLAVSTCSNSWANDGHAGPWYTTSDSKLHGNTLTISCPGSGTAWHVQYGVWYQIPGSNDVWPILFDRSGNGSTSFSASVSPVTCHPNAQYHTFAHNYDTGGNINKPLVSNFYQIC